MPCLLEAIQEAMKNLPTIYMYTGQDGSEHPEDSNLKDIQHLAETIQKVCNLNVNSNNAQQDLSKQQAVEIVEIVEKLGGYLLNGKVITNYIFIPNHELKNSSKINK